MEMHDMLTCYGANSKKDVAWKFDFMVYILQYSGCPNYMDRGLFSAIILRILGPSPSKQHQQAMLRHLQKNSGFQKQPSSIIRPKGRLHTEHVCRFLPSP